MQVLALIPTQSNVFRVTQSKSKTQIARSVHGKFNCITVKYIGTQHGIYVTVGITGMHVYFCPPFDRNIIFIQLNHPSFKNKIFLSIWSKHNNLGIVFQALWSTVKYSTLLFLCSDLACNKTFFVQLVFMSGY